MDNPAYGIILRILKYSAKVRQKRFSQENRSVFKSVNADAACFWGIVAEKHPHISPENSKRIERRYH
jgi:hypothetical protein